VSSKHDEKRQAILFPIYEKEEQVLEMKGFVPTPPEIVDLMVQKLFEERAPALQDVILDPGCGKGAFIEGIIRWCHKHRVRIPRIIGVDSHPQLVREARKRLKDHPRVETRLQDFLDKPGEPRYSFIIGNPPYVPITGLSEDERDRYRKLYRTAQGRFDLYLLFFEQALRQLLPNGRIVFITPEKFLYVDTARPLRQLLGRMAIQSIHLVSEDTFGELVTYPTITTVKNTTSRSSTTVILRNGHIHRVALPADGRSWWPTVQAGSDRPLCGKGTKLRDLCVRISCGVATGADAVFVHPTKSLAPSLRPFAYPTISGRQLSNIASTLPRPTHSMLIPYGPDGELLKEGALDGLRSYLTQPVIRDRLLQRTCVSSKPWYAFHENPPFPDILRPKILCKDITPQPRFWIDRSSRLIPRHSVYYIVPKHPEHLEILCDHLNSDEAFRWLASHCQRAANGFLRLQSHVLKELPIPSDLLPANAKLMERQRTGIKAALRCEMA
jgi:SAM-dependent methyltransferase